MANSLTRTTALLLVAITVASGCSLLPGDADCDDPGVPESAIPTARGLSLVATAEVEPEGCGAGWRRTAVLIAGTRDSEAALALYVAALEDQQWDPVDCAAHGERCFESPDGYFLAASTPENPGGMDPPEDIPASFGTQPRVLVSVQWQAEDS